MLGMKMGTTVTNPTHRSGRNRYTACTYCGLYYTQLGIGRHWSKCPKKPTAHLNPEDPMIHHIPFTPGDDLTVTHTKTFRMAKLEVKYEIHDKNNSFRFRIRSGQTRSAWKGYDDIATIRVGNTLIIGTTEHFKGVLPMIAVTHAMVDHN